MAMSAPVKSSPVALATVGLLGLGLLTSPSFAVTPSARYSDRDVLLGSTVHTRGQAPRRPPRSALVLQRKFPARWRTVDGSARRSGHGYVLRVPTDRIGTIVVRVAARRGGAGGSPPPPPPGPVR